MLARFDDLARVYSEPPRSYHNLNHIDDCLRQFDLIRPLAEHPDSIEIAIWFHDAIYDSQEMDNEQKSADLAAEMLKAARVPRIDQIVELIMVTRHDAPLESIDAQIIVDVDLSILGREPEEFDRYDSAIREEYSWVPIEAFRNGRAQVLESFLSRQAIFSTDLFRQKYEKQARENLERVIRNLRNA